MIKTLIYLIAVSYTHLSKKVLKVEVINKKRKDDYKLILQEYDPNTLTESEKIALNLIINEIGNSKEVVLYTIRKHCSTLSNAKDVYKRQQLSYFCCIFHLFMV